jgi:hypothetical protein
VGFTKKEYFIQIQIPTEIVPRAMPSFSNRNSFGTAPPFACRALTMVKFPMKEGGDDLSQGVHFFDSRGRKTFNRLYIPYAIN